MTKQELKSQIESLDVKVKSIRQYGDTFKVKISWKDYLKVKHLFSEVVQFVF